MESAAHVAIIFIGSSLSVGYIPDIGAVGFLAD
jgi:hypothetical protein